MAQSNVSVTTTATRIVTANNARQGLMVSNHGNNPLYIGPDSSVSLTNGIIVPPKGTFGNSGRFTWRGELYGIVEFDSMNVAYWEWPEA